MAAIRSLRAASLHTKGSDSACDLSHSGEDKAFPEGLDKDMGEIGVRRGDTVDEATLLADIAALQSTEELAQYWNYPCETHTVKTADNYHLQTHRIASPRFHPTSYTRPLPSPSPAVILWHGLAISSEAWVCSPGGPKSNLAFVLADAGFDVWMPNSRGNKYSMKHEHHEPRGKGAKEYWDFGLDEMARWDLKAVVEMVREKTGRRRVSYVGFSQGTALAFAALSMDEELNEMVDLFVGLAPAMRPKPIANPNVNYLINRFSPSILFTVLGSSSFLPFADSVRTLIGPARYSAIVQGALETLFGWECNKWPEHWRPALYSHLFSHASMRCVVHWFQIITSGVFAHYDHTPPSSYSSYFFATSPASTCKPVAYPTQHIRTKTHLFAGGNDNISDVDHLREMLPKEAVIEVVDDYEHMDFLWAPTAKSLVWDQVVQLIKDQQ